MYIKSIEVTYTTGGSTGPTAPSATVTFSPAAGEVASGSTVALSLNGTADGIKYTTDGSDVTSSSTTYSSPIEITEATTIKAAAYNYSNSTYAFGTAASAAYTVATTPSTSGVMTFTPSSKDEGTLANAPNSSVTASISDFAGYTTGQGAQRTAGTGTITFSNLPSTYKVTKIVVEYCTNKSSGVGTISATLNDVAIGTSFSATVIGTDGRTLKEATLYDNSTGTAFSGDLVITTAVTTNSVFINKVSVYYEQIAAKAYDVTVTQAEGGTITASPVGEKVVDANDKITVTATPDTGYAFGSWSFTGVSESDPDANNQITATGNVTITASFNKVKYNILRTITTNGASSTAGGWLGSWTGYADTPDATDATGYTVNAYYGSTVTFKAGTENGYQVGTVTATAGGSPVTLTVVSSDDTGTVYSFTMPASAVTITANFVPYHPTVKLGGLVNGSTWISDVANGVALTYDSTADKYTGRVFFTGNREESGVCDYFFVFEDNAAKYPSATGNYWITSVDGTAMTISLTGGSSSNFRIEPGIYDIELNGGRTSLKVTKVTPTLTFSPASGSVETGSSVSASSNLYDLLHAINSSITTNDVTDEVSGDNSTWAASYTFANGDVGSKTVYARSTYGNIAVTGSASYTVTKAENSNKYQRVTSIVTGKKYLIAYEGESLIMGANNGGKSAAVSSGFTMSDGVVNVTDTSNGIEYVWFESDGNGNYYMKNADGKYYVVSTSNTNLSTSSSTSTLYITFEGNDAKIAGESNGTRQLGLNTGVSQRVFGAYSNPGSSSQQKLVQLYQQVATGEHEITYVYDSDKLNVFGVSDANKGDQVTVTTSGKTVEGTNYACSGITVTTSDSNNSPLTVTAGSNGTYTFSVPNNLAADATITVTASYTASYPLTYVSQYYDKDGNLNVSESQNQKGGTVTGPSAAVEGATVSVTVTPYDDFQLKTLKYENMDITNSRQFSMPHSATTVTATFELVPHTFTVNEVGGTGSVTGLPASAVAGTSVTFTVTPPSGCTVSSLTVTHTGGTVQVTDNGGGSYSFNMPGADVAININYFASDFYNLLTNVSDINAGDTYLIVTQAKDNVMSKTVNNGSLGVVALTSSNYDDQEDIITSTADMAIVNFVPGTGENDGKWAIHIAGGYLGNGTGSGNSLTVSDTPTYATITVNNGVAELALAVEGSHNLLRQNGSLFKFYASNSGATQPRIYKLASTVSAPVIAGSVDATIGTGKFIGLDEITISSATSGASIYYTTDGTEPSASNGTLYSGAFSLTGETPAALGDRITVKAVAISGGESSAVRSQTFECVRPTWQTKTVDGETVEAPFGDNWDGKATTFNNPMFLYPKRATNVKQAYGEENIYYYYSTDGTTPVISEATKCRSNSSGAYVFANVNMNLRAIIVVNGVASEPRGNAITFVPAAPTISLPTGTYAGEQRVSLSTTTKQQQNNVKWTTHIFYNVEAGATEFDQLTMLAADGTLTAAATAAGWKLYDTSTSPYIDIPSPSTTTLRAVTATNFYGDTGYTGSARTLNGTWQVAEATATYTVTAADLDVVFSPAGGTYLYTKKVTLHPQNVYGGTEDANFAMTYTLTWAHTDSKHVNKTNETYHLGDTITIDQDATLSVYAIDGRPNTGYGNGVYSGEHTYKIGVQQPMFSPLPSSYNTNDPTDSAWVKYYVEDGSDYKCLAEIFTVSPDAQIYYTSSHSASSVPDAPGNPDKTKTRYTGKIELQEGFTTFKAIAYVGSMVSEVRTVTYQVVKETDDDNEYWYCIAEMNKDEDAKVKTFRNPIEVTYMSSHQNNGTTPEYAFVRDDSGYGYIYFGGQDRYEGWKIFKTGDWLPGNTISGMPSVWSDAYMNELGGNAKSTGITAWPDAALTNRAIVPEYTTNRAIREGWTYEGAYTGSDYATYVDMDKMMFGHYVHLRRNTFHDVVKWKPNETLSKYIGVINGELGTDLCYYDGFYLFSGYNGGVTYNQAFFDDIQNRGGTFAVYGIVQFYGPNASVETYAYQPFEIFPVDFDWIFPPIFHLSGDNTAADKTNRDIERTVYEPKSLTLDCETRGAQIWYKTSDMEDFKVYEGDPISINKTTVIEAYSTHSTQHFDELISVHRTLTVNMGEVKQPVISPESVVKAIGGSTTVTITCESSDATIWYTTDGSDPSDESNEARHEYDNPFPVTSTCTVNAIAEKDGYNSAAAEPKTYTFVKSNGIEYDLVTEASQLTESNIYVIVNKEAHMAIQRTQKDNNRDGAGVLFTDATKTKVYGNDDLAMFTIHNNGDGTWTLHTSNGSDNKSIGYIYGNVSGTTNQLKTDFTKAQDDSKYRANITIGANDSGVDKAYAATIQFNGASDGFRQLRFNKQFGLFNTYLNTSTTGQEVFLYYKEAFPLANIEVAGKVGTDYTIADELIGVHAVGTKLYAKDQGNVSIIKTENTGGWIDYVAELEKRTEEWDQSNWVCLDFGDADIAGSLEGQSIAPATITGTYTDDLNYTIEVKNAGSIVPKAKAAYKVNVLHPANFNTAYLNQGENGVEMPNGRKFWFVNPKVQEVVFIKNAVWDGFKFVVPARQDKDGNTSGDVYYSMNGNGFEGGFTIDLSMNTGVASTTNLTPNYTSEFLAIVTRNDWNYGRERAAVNQSVSSAPRRIKPGSGTASSSITVMPLSLTGGSLTEVKDLSDTLKEVKAVRYIDVVGRVSDRPFEGLNIIVTEYTDGSVETVKVFK